MECVYATFSSYCAKRSRVMWCLLKHGENTYVFTVPFVMETTLTNDVLNVVNETVVSDAFGRVFSYGRACVPVQEGVRHRLRVMRPTIAYNQATEVKILQTVFLWRLPELTIWSHGPMRAFETAVNLNI